MKSFQLRSLYAQFLCDFDGVDANPLKVLMGSLVFGFDGKRQSLNSTQMKIRHLLDMALLVLKFTEIQAVGAIDKVHGGNDEQRRFPVERLVEPCDGAGDAGPH